VRHVIFPTLKQLSNDPVESFSRLTENLRSDLDYLNSQAERFLADVGYENIRASSIRELHPAIQARVFSILVHQNTGIYVEEKHITALKELIKSDNFRYSLPGEKMFACERGICIFLPKKNTNNVFTQIFSLAFGENKISGTNLTVFIGDVDKTSLNVYNFSIQASISSAIIDSGLILRFKYDGDSYRYSGKTHKLKKVFNDRNIPPSQRSRIPIICDSEGIVLLPGMSVRDGAISDVSSDNIPITFAYGTPSDTEAELFTALLRR
jgi:tRNA(Ile)-lysidine synthase